MRASTTRAAVRPKIVLARPSSEAATVPLPPWLQRARRLYAVVRIGRDGFLAEKVPLRARGFGSHVSSPYLTE